MSMQDRDHGIFGGFTSTTGSPYPYMEIDVDGNLKQSHEVYEVYVNGEYVGSKILMTQNEDISAVDDFLAERGFNQFVAEVEGDHYNISAQDPRQVELIKENLAVYLQIR